MSLRGNKFILRFIITVTLLISGCSSGGVDYFVLTSLSGYEYNVMTDVATKAILSGEKFERVGVCRNSDRSILTTFRLKKNFMGRYRGARVAVMESENGFVVIGFHHEISGINGISDDNLMLESEIINSLHNSYGINSRRIYDVDEIWSEVYNRLIRPAYTSCEVMNN